MPAYVLHPDPLVAAALVDGMRLRGIEAVPGSSAEALLEHAKERAPSLLAIPAEWLAGDGALAPAGFQGLRAAVGGAPEVGIPPLDVHDAGALDAVLEEIERTFAPHHPAPPSARGAELEGDLASTPLLDLLEMLWRERRSGTLTITTSSASAELHVVEGDVLDAMFRRAEGVKALVRLAREAEGAFYFSKGAPVVPRRIDESGPALLRRVAHEVAAIDRIRSELGTWSGAQVLASAGSAGSASADPSATNAAGAEIERAITRHLELNCALDDVLELAFSDADILAALDRLERAGVLRRIPGGEARPSIAGPDGMGAIRVLAGKIRPRGYRSPPRLVLTGSAPVVRLVRQAVARLAEASPGGDSGGNAAHDGLIETSVTLHLGEAVALDIVTLVDSTALIGPLPLVLGGAAGVVTLDRPSRALVSIVEELEIALLDADSVSYELEGATPDPGDPADVAAMIRGALEGIAGS